MDGSLEVLRGTLDLMILEALRTESLHGYGITKWIRQRSGDAFQVEDGALYPALHRLEHGGWIQSSWGTSENNRRAKYYRLTAAGKKRLEHEVRTWERFSDALGRLLRSSEG